MNCRHCGAPLRLPMVDLGTAPPSNAYLTPMDLQGPESWFPLRVLVCERCWLAQTEDFVGREQLFSGDYAYFSSYSASWLRHAERYVHDMVERFGLDGNSLHVEVASNDGYLLQYSAARGIPCLGVEPTHGTAEAARAKGIETIEGFFGVDLAESLGAQGRRADLMTANNVLAHVPDINDFVRGFAILLEPDGVATFEFPHLQCLMEEAQFDTIYHEHYSYLSLTAVDTIFSANGLAIFDVEQLSTHGGSLRVYAQRRGGPRARSEAVDALLEEESRAGVSTVEYYRGLQSRAERIKNDLLAFLIEARRQGSRVGAYGAAAKGNTLLNFSGIRRDLLPWVVDRNPAKRGKYLPGGRIPIVSEEIIDRERPDYLLILPWNLREEIESQLACIRDWGGRFVVAIPELSII